MSSVSGVVVVTIPPHSTNRVIVKELEVNGFGQ